MTTIAWDGRTLATDRQADVGGGKASMTKCSRTDKGELLAFSGSAAHGLQMVDWYVRGADPDKFPPSQRGDDWCRLVVVIPEGKLMAYERTPYPLRFGDRKIAFGSGGDFARAAMHCGCDARQAVEVAACFDPHTGGGVDVLTLAVPC